VLLNLKGTQEQCFHFLFLGGEGVVFFGFFNLKSMISTDIKEICEKKKVLNFTRFFFNQKNHQQLPASNQNIKRFFKKLPLYLVYSQI